VPALALSKKLGAKAAKNKDLSRDNVDVITIAAVVPDRNQR